MTEKVLKSLDSSPTFKSSITSFMLSCCWKCKECDYEFLDKRELKKHERRKHDWKRISSGSTGFKLFKCFSGSTGL